MKSVSMHPIIQHITNNLHIKYDYSSLHDSKETFDIKFHYLKYGKKENQTNTEKNKQKADSQFHDTTLHHQPAYQI